LSKRFWACIFLILLIGGFLIPPATFGSQDTDIAGVNADLAFLRQYNGVLHLGVILHNRGPREAAAHQALEFANVVVIDSKANRKFFPLKDANGHYLAGPISDWNGGGRWYPKLLPKSDTLVWVLFDAVPAGDTVTVDGPLFHSFNNLHPTDQPPEPGTEATSSVPPLRAAVKSATRSNAQLKVELKVSNPENVRIGSHTLSYRDVYALDPQGKRSYPLFKDENGLFLANPMADKNDGGRWFLSRVAPNGQALLDLTFQAPPDSVHSVDIVVPWFAPLEAVTISGEGGAAESGLGVAGASTELQRALKDLNAEVAPNEVKVNLSADLLFDFDKANLKPEAAPELKKVATILKSYPISKVKIEGHADAKGSDEYNQKLSERRAQTVAQWLMANAGIDASRVKTRGWGKSKPIAPNTNLDGSDNPEGRAKNRRVEITLIKS